MEPPEGSGVNVWYNMRVASQATQTPQALA